MASLLQFISRLHGFWGRSKSDALHARGVLSAGTSLQRIFEATVGTRWPKIQETERNSGTACTHTSFVLHLCRICCPIAVGTRLEPGDILMLLASNNPNYASQCMSGSCGELVVLIYIFSNNFIEILWNKNEIVYQVLLYNGRPNIVRH